MDKTWHIDKYDQYLLEVKRDTYTAAVKWDGCIHFNEQNEDGTKSCLHICHLDSFIAMLTDLRDEARAHFGDEWGK